MGHGVQAAMVMSVVKAALYSAVPVDPRPARVLASVNKTLERLFGDYFVTATCCLVDPRGARGACLGWSRGTMVVQSQDRRGIAERPSRLPLGIAETTAYEAVPLELDKGDALVFSTDGLVEGPNPRGKQYGDERVKAQVLCHGRSSAAGLCEGIRRDFEGHCRDHAREDDLTLLVVKLVG